MYIQPTNQANFRGLVQFNKVQQLAPKQKMFETFMVNADSVSNIYPAEIGGCNIKLLTGELFNVNLTLDTLTNAVQDAMSATVAQIKDMKALNKKLKKKHQELSRLTKMLREELGDCDDDGSYPTVERTLSYHVGNMLG